MNEQPKQEQKPIIIARAVSTIDMLNIINDKLDYLIASFSGRPEVKK